MGGPTSQKSQVAQQAGQSDERPSPKSKAKPGALRLEAVLKNGKPTPEAIVAILEKYPAEQAEILETLNQDPRLGMSFTHQVIAILTKPRDQRPQPAGATQSDREIPIEPEGYYSPSKPRESMPDGEVVGERSRHTLAGRRSRHRSSRSSRPTTPATRW